MKLLGLILYIIFFATNSFAENNTKIKCRDLFAPPEHLRHEIPVTIKLDLTSPWPRINGITVVKGVEISTIKIEKIIPGYIVLNCQGKILEIKYYLAPIDMLPNEEGQSSKKENEKKTTLFKKQK